MGVAVVVADLAYLLNLADITLFFASQLIASMGYVYMYMYVCNYCWYLLGIWLVGHHIGIGLTFFIQLVRLSRGSDTRMAVTFSCVIDSVRHSE